MTRQFCRLQSIGSESAEFLSLALLRSYGRKAGNQLADALAAAVRTLDLGFLEVRDVKVLGEFHVAVLAVVDVLRHGLPPSQHHSAVACGWTMKSRRERQLSAVRAIERLAGRCVFRNSFVLRGTRVHPCGSETETIRPRHEETMETIPMPCHASLDLYIFGR